MHPDLDAACLWQHTVTNCFLGPELQRMKTDAAGALPHDLAVDADGKPAIEAQAYLLQWFMGKERAVITIQVSCFRLRDCQNAGAEHAS